MTTNSLPSHLPSRELMSGEPCESPGCASHLSHPCENCGRFAAGTRDRPDTRKAWERIVTELRWSNPVVYAALNIMAREVHQGKPEWTIEEKLVYLVQVLVEHDTKTSEALSEYITNYPVPLITRSGSTNP